MSRSPELASSPYSVSPQATKEEHVPGEAGVWVFIIGDMLVFAAFFVSYLRERADDVAVFAASQRELNQWFGLANTLVLLMSSLFVVYAIRSLQKRHESGTSPALFAAAIACGFGFCILKGFEWWAELSHGVTPATNDFFMMYFLMTGVHLFHVLVGIGVLFFLFATSRKAEVADSRIAVAEGGACFWHMVDLLWIGVFTLVYLVH